MASSQSQQQELLESVAKTNSTVTSSLHRAIRHHTNNEEYDAKTDGLDYLEVKNGMMLSYLIDLTMLLRCRLQQNEHQSGENSNNNRNNDLTSQQCIERLLETKAALEKIRPLEKRLRYQIDKLLALSTLGAGTFAAVGREEEKEDKRGGSGDRNDDSEDEGREDKELGENDPLSFRPDLEGMMGAFDDNDKQPNEDEDDSHAESDADREFGSNKSTIALEKAEHSQNQSIYQPPRLQAMPFEDNEQKHAKEERLRRKQQDRMRNSELAEVVRAQFTDAPEEEDIRGGAMLGKQRELSRRVAQRDQEIGEFEETHMIRLTMGRKEKKERKRMMREEMSNLSAIADLGNVVKGMDDAFGDEGERGRKSGGESFVTKGMRKRKVDVMDHEIGQQGKRAGRRSKGAVNSFQKALYGGRGGGGGSGKSKKKK